MNLKLCEKETIVRTSADYEDCWQVFTYNPALIKKLKAYAAQYPEWCRFVKDNGIGGMFFEVNRDRLTITLKPKRPELSLEQRNKARERLMKFHQSKREIQANSDSEI